MNRRKFLGLLSASAFATPGCLFAGRCSEVATFNMIKQTRDDIQEGGMALSGLSSAQNEIIMTAISERQGHNQCVDTDTTEIPSEYESLMREIFPSLERFDRVQSYEQVVFYDGDAYKARFSVSSD